MMNIHRCVASWRLWWWSLSFSFGFWSSILHPHPRSGSIRVNRIGQRTADSGQYCTYRTYLITRDTLKDLMCHAEIALGCSRSDLPHITFFLQIKTIAFTSNLFPWGTSAQCKVRSKWTDVAILAIDFYPQYDTYPILFSWTYHLGVFLYFR